MLLRRLSSTSFLSSFVSLVLGKLSVTVPLLSKTESITVSVIRFDSDSALCGLANFRQHLQFSLRSEF